MMVTPYIILHFFFVMLVGFSACRLLWKVSTPAGRKTVSWRILFCIILAASITPTKYPFIFDSWFLAPAAELIIFRLLDDENAQPKVSVFIFGVIPIATVSVISFVILTLWQSRK